MPGFPKPAPAKDARGLERWILDKAREDGVAVERLRRSVSFMVISAGSSQVDGELRELRPDMGNTHYRLLYRRVPATSSCSFTRS